jgi:hypothetical protein
LVRKKIAAKNAQSWQITAWSIQRACRVGRRCTPKARLNPGPLFACWWAKKVIKRKICVNGYFAKAVHARGLSARGLRRRRLAARARARASEARAAAESLRLASEQEQPELSLDGADGAPAALEPALVATALVPPLPEVCEGEPPEPDDCPAPDEDPETPVEASVMPGPASASVAPASSGGGVLPPSAGGSSHGVGAGGVPLLLIAMA